MRRMLDLQRLALLLRQSLIVGDLLDDFGNARAERPFQLRSAGFRVFQRVMQQCPRQHARLGNAADSAQDFGQRDWVIDVAGFLGLTLMT